MILVPSNIKLWLTPPPLTLFPPFIQLPHKYKELALGTFSDTAEPDSGLFTDYTGVVTDAWFATNTRFGGMQLNLQQTTNAEGEHEVHTEQINCGESWDSLDGGKTVEHKDGKTKFHANSRVSKFLVRLGELGAFEDLDSRGLKTTDAEAYVGLNLRWEEQSEPYNMKDRETGQQVSGVSRYNMPVEYLGITANPTISTTQHSGPSFDLASLPTTLVDDLRSARQRVSSHDEFMNEAIQLTGVSGNGMLLAAIADKDQLYKELANT